MLILTPMRKSDKRLRWSARNCERWLFTFVVASQQLIISHQRAHDKPAPLGEVSQPLFPKGCISKRWYLFYFLCWLFLYLDAFFNIPFLFLTRSHDDSYRITLCDSFGHLSVERRIERVWMKLEKFIAIGIHSPPSASFDIFEKNYRRNFT